MWPYIVFFFGLSSALEDSPVYFCADMNPQRIVNVMQLMGMWYAVEKIDHLDDRHHLRSLPTCPIIHFSEDHPPTTPNPLYRNIHNRGYGEGFAYGTGGSQHGKTVEQINQERQQRLEYDTRAMERNRPRGQYQHYNAEERYPLYTLRYLRIYVDEEGVSTEYHARYNVTTPGFWISSGPENGATLKSQFSHYAGNIQVLKVVGNHMVLTFCHRLGQLGEHQLTSIILSRETQLNPVEIHTIHSMLNRKGLKTNAVEKMCNNSVRFTLSNCLGLFLVTLFICRMVK